MINAWIRGGAAPYSFKSAVVRVATLIGGTGGSVAVTGGALVVAGGEDGLITLLVEGSVAAAVFAEAAGAEGFSMLLVDGPVSVGTFVTADGEGPAGFETLLVCCVTALDSASLFGLAESADFAAFFFVFFAGAVSAGPFAVPV